MWWCWCCAICRGGFLYDKGHCVLVLGVSLEFQNRHFPTKIKKSKPPPPVITNSSNHWHWWLIQPRVCKTDACYQKNTRNMITFQPSWIGHSSNARLDGGISLHWSQDPIHWLLYSRIYSYFENKKPRTQEFSQTCIFTPEKWERKNIPNEQSQTFLDMFPRKIRQFCGALCIFSPLHTADDSMTYQHEGNGTEP